MRPTTAVAVVLILVLAAMLGSRTESGSAKAAPPPTVPDAKQKIVVFVPHADDDALSMGVYVQEMVRTGHDVTTVLYTDGGGTAICALVDGICTANDPFHGETLAEFSAQRDAEYKQAVLKLGVPEKNILIYKPSNGPRPHDGQVSGPQMRQMIDYYNHYNGPDGDFRNATFLTMSWLDQNYDHAGAGIALREAVAEGRIPRDRALFTMARWYWAYAYPQRPDYLTSNANDQRVRRGFPIATKMMSCDSSADPADCKARMYASLDAYKCPDGAQRPKDCTGIGYSSVPVYIDTAREDPRIILHSVESARYPSRIAVTAAKRPGGGTGGTLTGYVIVPSYGRQGTDYKVPANAPWLSQSLDATKLRSPFSTAARVVATALDAKQRPLAVRRLALGEIGTFTGAARLPAGTTALSLYTEETGGAMPASMVLPVQTLAMSFGRHAKSIKIKGRTVSGSYGQRFAVKVRPTVARRTAAGTLVQLTGGFGLSGQGRTDRKGTAAFTGALGKGSLSLSSGAPVGAVPAGRIVIHTKVKPTALRVGVTKASLVSRAGTVALSGGVAGKKYAIARTLLIPVQVKIYRASKSGKKFTYVRTVTTRTGGRFTAIVAAGKGQRLRFVVAGRKGAFSKVANAGEAQIR